FNFSTSQPLNSSTSSSLRSHLLQLHQSRHQFVVRVFERLHEQPGKKSDRCQQRSAHNKVMRAQPLPSWQKSQDPEHPQKHDHGIEACSLPITPAQMEPHAELIE